MAAELAAETLLHLGPLPVTNTLVTTLIVDCVIIAGLISFKKGFTKKVPGFLQNTLEYAVEGMYSLTESIAQENTAKIFPWFMSFFIFLLISNWLGLLPGFGTIGFHNASNFVPFFRSAGSDINFTLALALISVFTTQIFSIHAIGIKQYIQRYFSINPIFLFVGLLELLSIFTSIISLSFRLFGNILAGETVLSTISNIFAFILPLPFLSLEIIVGFVQALVFATLTMASMAILMTPHSSDH